MRLEDEIFLRNIVALDGGCFDNGRFPVCSRCPLKDRCNSDYHDKNDRYLLAKKTLIDNVIDDILIDR